MNKPTIAIDIDDVLADGTAALIESVNKRYGLSLTDAQYHSVGGDFHGYYERVWQTHGAGDIVRFEDISEEMTSDQSHVPLLAGAEFAFHELAKQFHVIFITARPVLWEAATRRWFKQNLTDADIELYFAGNHYDSKSRSKGELAVELGAKLLIDDNVANCQSALEAGIETILFGTYGWHSGAPENMVRCKGWPEVLEYLSEARV